ncbi:MAG: ABC transporter permease, partial [Oscillospiraceae bacterium]|nr:ABC transporter permease [Oscillospiraceae bacterium]
MGSMIRKDFFREIRHTFSRFLSILILVALAVAFFSGLRSTAPDMKRTGDEYLDSLHLADIQIMSNLGLTQDDIAALAEQENILAAEGAYMLDTYAAAGDQDLVAKVYSLTERGINDVELRSGRLPTSAAECAVDEHLLGILGISVGDTVSILPHEDMEDSLRQSAFTVVGAVRSPMYISLERGTSSLGTGSVNAYIYLPKESFDMEVYTVAYLLVDGAAEMTAFCDEYDDYIESIVDTLEPFGEVRAALRYDTLMEEANGELSDAEKELADAKAEVEAELADAESELADARRQLDNGWSEYYSGREEFYSEKARGEAELADAEVQLNDAHAELTQGELDYEEGLAELEAGKAELADAEAQLKAASGGLAAAERQLAEAKATLDSAQSQLNTLAGAVAAQLGVSADALLGDLASDSPTMLASANAVLAGMEQTLSTYIAAAQQSIDMIDMALLDPNLTEEERAAYLEQRRMAEQQKAALQAQYDAMLVDGSFLTAEYMAAAQRELNVGWEEYYEGAAALESGRNAYRTGYAQYLQGKEELAEAETALADARAQLDQGWIDYETGLAELEEGKITFAEEITQAETDLADARSELIRGEAEYNDGYAEFEDGKREAEEEIAEAEEKIADARREISEIENGEWYVFSRSYNPGYTGFGQDADRMGNLAAVFPLIFFLVAALVCLTTMTRMVEEHRVEIGSLKALGYGPAAISMKYIGYGLLPSLIGGVLGLAIGYTLFPSMIFTAYQLLYEVPSIQLHAHFDITVISMLAAVACTTVSTLGACLATLRAAPAALMRPKTPKAGKRILLERVTPLWKRMKFTYKVTARNLLRYKKRFFMTVAGIGGCTALIIAGFGLRSSLLVTVGRQYEDLLHHTAQISLADSALEEDRDTIEGFVTKDARIADFAAVRMIPTTAITEEYSITAYAEVIDPADAARFMTLLDYDTGEEFALTDEGAFIDLKLSELLGVGVGDTVFLDGDERMEVTVAGIFEHYMGHFVYMTPAYYESLSGAQTQTNSYLVTLAEGADADAVYEDLVALDGIAALSSNHDARETYENRMSSIDFVVVIV